MNGFEEFLSFYAYEIYSFVYQTIECMFVALLFMMKHKKRKFFVLRFTLCVIVNTVLSILLAILNKTGGADTSVLGIVVRILCYTTCYFLCLAAIFICDGENPTEILTCWCKTIALHQLVGKLYPLLQNILGIDDKKTISLINEDQNELYDFIIFYAFRLILYPMFVYIFRKDRTLYDDPATKRSTVTLSMFFVIVVNCFIMVSRKFESESWALNIIVKLLTILFSIVILSQFNLINQKNKSTEENAVLQQLWRQDKLQFKSIKSNIDFINGKCHDLKHILNKLEGKLNSAELDELSEAIKFYDNSISTGNEILDVVICEKQIVCQGYGINFSCMADGSKLNGFTATQLYSLFGNMLDNAIEASRHLQPAEKRVISLTVKNKNGETEIRCTNYYDGEDLTNNSEDVRYTSKEDKDLHGYGLMSIRSIAQSHGGSVNITAKGGIFDMIIYIPYSEENN